MKIGYALRLPLFARTGGLGRNERGATAAIFAIMLPVIAGMAALAIDVGVWTVQKRQAQGAADQAAYSAAVASKAGNSDDQTRTWARGITADMGFAHGVRGVVVDVNSPPLAGSFAGQSGYWEVIVHQPQTAGLAALFLSRAPTAAARAVAGGSADGAGCIIALSPTAANAIFLNNNAKLTNPSCDLYSNSNSSSSIRCNNNCEIAASMFAVGAVSWGNKKPAGTITDKGSWAGGPIADPYADLNQALVTSSMPPCTVNTVVTNGGNLSPGRYCQGFNLPNSASNHTVNLAPGIYYIDKSFAFGNNFTVNGTGVTLVFRPDTSVSTFNFSLGNGMTFNLSAPTSGTFAGVAMMGISNLPANPTFANNTIMHIQGALYFPKQNLTLQNNLDAAYCTQLVALTVSLNNNATMNHHCPGSGIKGGGKSSIALME